MSPKETHDLILHCCRKAIEQGYFIENVPFYGWSKEWYDKSNGTLNKEFIDNKNCDPIGAVILMELFDESTFTQSFVESFGQTFAATHGQTTNELGAELGKVFRDYWLRFKAR